MPQVNHLGVSRRIHDAAERDRLRQLVRSLRPPGAAASSCARWARGGGRRSSAPTSSSSSASGSRSRRASPRRPPRAALHEEGDLVFRVVRDLFAADVEEILIDGEEEYRRALEYAESLVPALVDRIHLHAERESVFEARGIEKEIEKAIRRRVWLKSGRLPGDRSHRGAGVDRREHRQVRRQARPRGDDPQDQPGGGGRDRPADPPARPGRDHHHRLHRHGPGGPPRPGVPRAQARAGGRQVAHERARDLRARPRGDDPEACAAEPALAPDAVLPDLQGHRRGEVGRPPSPRRSTGRSRSRSGTSRARRC